MLNVAQATTPSTFFIMHRHLSDRVLVPHSAH
nr:MAG TPA: hypothetical protein [Caudoviricetes sp.]